jgi:hypothetical protein
MIFYIAGGHLLADCTQGRKAMVSIVRGGQKQPDQTQIPATLPACPVCAGRLDEHRGQVRCSECHTLCESACDGEAWWFLGAASWPGAWEAGSM